MLTKDLLTHRARKGRIYPGRVDTTHAGTLALAEALLAIAGGAPGEEQGDIEEGLLERANQHDKPVLAKGLVKLISDRFEVEEPDEGALSLRTEVFATAREVVRGMPADAGLEALEAALSAAIPDLAGTRAALYRDLDAHRKITGFDPLGPGALLERYNLAQVQGLVLHARRLTLRIEEASTVVLRRVLRHLKFCRLVAEASKEGSLLTLVVEGPAALFGTTRKYGLQLASFIAAVPLLPRFRLSAEIELPRRGPLALELSEADGLVSTLAGGLGHVPEEIRSVLEKLEGGAWTVDLAPEPRPVGVRGLAVPDLGFRHPARGLEVAVELFHQWHRGALERRLRELEERPDPGLLLGVDRSLYRDAALAARLEAAPAVFQFNAFPSERVLKKVLARLEG